tara:strand:+ start:26 stop:565 length:540 start_codon:yes stop_codon:yes gene_type:complete
MATETFSLLFNGQTKDGIELNMVQKGLVTLLQIDEDMVREITSGNSVELKNGLDKATAEKYQRALLQIGAVTHISDSSDDYEAEKERYRARNSYEFDLNSRRDIPAKFLDNKSVPKALDTALSEPGAILVESNTAFQAEFDISHFSLAKAGETIVPRAIPVKQDFDLNYLSLEGMTKRT